MAAYASESGHSDNAPQTAGSDPFRAAHLAETLAVALKNRALLLKLGRQVSDAPRCRTMHARSTTLQKLIETIRMR